jgi:hypothetical protein
MRTDPFVLRLSKDKLARQLRRSLSRRISIRPKAISELVAYPDYQPSVVAMWSNFP